MGGMPRGTCGLLLTTMMTFQKFVLIQPICNVRQCAKCSVDVEVCICARWHSS